MPKVVGETAAGEPVYEIQSVRLLLGEDANHFNRIVACSKCGKQVPGPPVLSPADLDHPPHAVICGQCVRAATAPMFSTGPAGVASNGATAGPDLPDDGRLGAVERRLTDLAGLLQRQRMDWEAALQDRRNSSRAELAALATEVKELARAQEELARPDDGAAELARLVDPLEARIAAMQAAVEGETAAIRSDVAHLVRESEMEALEGRIHKLERAIEAEAARAQAEVAARRQAEGRLRRMEDLFNQRLDRLAEQAALLTGADRQLEAQRAATDRIAERVGELQARADAESARVEQGSAAAKQAQDDVARLDGQVGERLDRIAERMARVLEAEGRRQESVDRHEAMLARVPEGLERWRRDQQAILDRAGAERTDLRAALEAQGAELGTALREGLADVRSTITAVPADLTGRLDALEKHDQEREGEMSELGELHAALDTGLGTLRTELEEVRTAMRWLADGHDDLDDRLEGFVRGALPADGDTGRGRRAGRKSAETQIGALSAVVEDLLREQRRLQDEIATLKRSAETATAAAARASSQASTVGPVRSDVRALHEQLAAQQEALATLGRTVERLRPRSPARTSRPAKD